MKWPWKPGKNLSLTLIITVLEEQNPKSFSTLPILSANWRFPSGKGRAFTRCISIPFTHHKDEPGALQLYNHLKEARINASASVGVLIRWCTEFNTEETQMPLHTPKMKL